MEVLGISPILADAVAASANDFSLHQIIGIIFGILGLIFFLGAAVGMLRFPDFYSRMHAAGKGDTLSTMLMLVGFGLVNMEDYSIVSWLVFIKIMAIVVFIYMTSPTSTHVLMKAAFEDNHMPLDETDLKKMKGEKK